MGNESDFLRSFGGSCSTENKNYSSANALSLREKRCVT